MLSPQMERAFNIAIAKFRENVNSEQLTDNIKLDAYKYYKQGIQGKCNISKPSIFNIKESAKWNAWNSIIDMSQEEAVEKYIALSFIF
jgi:acyl-CoA-binding protein